MKVPKLVPENYYHLYNRANSNHEKLFLTANDYLSFLSRYRKYCDDQFETLAYCLMPNHFHFLVNVKSVTTEPGRLSKTLSNFFNSYAKSFNKKYDRRGSLFQKPFKAKFISEERYLITLIHYIHQNPVRAGLRIGMEEWPFSSYLDLAGLRKGTLPDRGRIKEFYPTIDHFINDSNQLLQGINREYWV